MNTPDLPRKTLVLTTEHTALRALRPWLERCLHPSDPGQIGRIELAIQELAANVVDHSEPASERFTLHLDRPSGVVRIELRDDGNPVDDAGPSTREPHPRVGGYGLMIVEQLASTLRYERVGDENVWSVEFDCLGDG